MVDVPQLAFHRGKRVVDLFEASGAISLVFTNCKLDTVEVIKDGEPVQEDDALLLFQSLASVHPIELVNRPVPQAFNCESCCLVDTLNCFFYLLMVRCITWWASFIPHLLELLQEGLQETLFNPLSKGLVEKALDGKYVHLVEDSLKLDEDLGHPRCYLRFVGFGPVQNHLLLGSKLSELLDGVVNGNRPFKF